MTGILTNEQRITAFSSLGEYLAQENEELNRLVQTAGSGNGWFTEQEVWRSLRSLSEMLNAPDIHRWLGQEFEGRELPVSSPKNIGLVLAGNIPAVGFHDILAVLASGHTAMIKLSSQDKWLIPFLLEQLTAIEPKFTGTFRFVDRLQGFDAVIATGSNNTSRYFEYYFSKVPHIIRKNRHSIAVLDGSESRAELTSLGDDVFNYFGLGCRNVSKIYVPGGYNFTQFFESVEGFKAVADHHKYHNNYDYNKSIFLVNGDKHLDNGFLLVKEDDRIASPLAVLYFQEYGNLRQLEEEISRQTEQLQCIVSGMPLPAGQVAVNFGEGQHPRLWDYADQVNTLSFLNDL